MGFGVGLSLPEDITLTPVGENGKLLFENIFQSL